MKKKSQATIFEKKQVRRVWHENQWWFSVVDVVQILTDSAKPSIYWSAMKTRVKSDDGIELSTICKQLKLESADGKKYETDCADIESVFRIIQSIPSPKAEPFKRWLAKVNFSAVLGIDTARQF